MAAFAVITEASTVRYFEMLEDTLLVCRLDPFPEAASADLVQHPKFYFFDIGVLNGLLGNFSASLDRIRSLFEHLVVSQIRAAASARDRTLHIHSFRTRGGLEVDFVVSDGKRCIAIEAKTGANIQVRDSEALVAAKHYLPRNTRTILTVPAGAPRKLANGVEILPLPRLIEELV